MLIKNEIPILEYDDAPDAVINPDHEQLNLKLSERAVFAFLGDSVDTYCKEHHGEVVAYFESITKDYPLYLMKENGEEYCMIQAPAGAAAASQIMDWLISYGVKKIISAGSCGVLCDLKENVFLVPYKALRDEGTSYHYLPPSRFVEIPAETRIAIEAALGTNHLPYSEVITWTTDGFFRETKEKVAYRNSEGCPTVEMECSALASCAKMRNCLFGMILYTADTLADCENYDERGWGNDSKEIALRLCIEAVLNL